MKVDQMAGLGIVYLICCDGGLGEYAEKVEVNPESKSFFAKKEKYLP